MATVQPLPQTYEPPPPIGFQPGGQQVPPTVYQPTTYDGNVGFAVPGDPHTVVQTQTKSKPQKIKSKHPTTIVCPHCNSTVLTQTESQTGLITYAAAGISLLVGCWLGCCLIPFCMDDLKDTRHDCPNCKQTIDVYKPLS